jgi:hypothetical protein
MESANGARGAMAGNEIVHPLLPQKCARANQTDPCGGNAANIGFSLNLELDKVGENIAGTVG